MKTIFASLVILIISVYLVNCDDKYTSKYDNVDIEKILKNERLLKSYVDCLLDRGKCSKDAEILKKLIPDALENECSKCTDKQKEALRKFGKYVMTEKPEFYKELKKKYDPEGKYLKKYEELAKKEGFTP